MIQLIGTAALAFSLIFSAFSGSAHALDFDWRGQFRTETNWLYGYHHGRLLTASYAGTDQGYFISNNGDSPASFQNLFLKLSPRAIVNDNVSIYSDIWFGNAQTGVFGGDQTGFIASSTNVNGTKTGNGTVNFNTVYAEVATDFGTLNIGRMPLNWGLGVMWNNTNDIFARLPSTGDGFRLETKFGAFKIAPAMYKYQLGSNFGGSTAGTSTLEGWSGVADYSLALSYSNDDEQMDLGLLFARRLAGPNATIVDPFNSSAAGGTTGYSYNVWDFYLKKKMGIVTLSAEVPIVTGLVNSKTYSTVAGAVKIDTQLSDSWKLKLNGGLADGQASEATAGTSTKLTAFSFHPDYRPGLLMFNYNYRAFSTPGSYALYNNPVTDAQFVSIGFDYNSNKWSHGFQWLYATASKVANQPGGTYFNNWDGRYKAHNAGAGAQEKGLGSEIDYTLGYQWDEALKLGLVMGLYFPGKFYEFSNGTGVNTLKTVFGSGLNLQVKF